MTMVWEGPPTTLAATPHRVLASHDRLFSALHEANLSYCHWKSSEHLGASMVGLTDLDLLIARKDAQRFERLLLELGCKRYVVQPGTGYPSVEDYLAFDEETGVISHVHVHYRLAVGEKFLKGYRLPWEELVLETRVKHEHYDVYATDPHLELILLIVRQALKVRARDVVRSALGGSYFRGGALRELHWLAARVRRPRLLELSRQLLGERAAARIAKVAFRARPTLGQLLGIRAEAVPPLRSYRMYNAVSARVRRWMIEARLAAWILRCRYLIAPIAVSWGTPTSPRGGLLVAVTGRDDHGARSVATALVDWLSPEAAVVPIFGKGRANRNGILSDREIARARRARDRGMVVFTDRPVVSDRITPDLVFDVDGYGSAESAALEAKRAVWNWLA